MLAARVIIKLVLVSIPVCVCGSPTPASKISGQQLGVLQFKSILSICLETTPNSTGLRLSQQDFPPYVSLKSRLLPVLLRGGQGSKDSLIRFK